jgi:flagellar basal-body rod protein FlgG
MFDAFYIGATGMRAHQAQVDTIANNVANLNTVGFRRGLVSFSEISQTVTQNTTDPVLAAVRASLPARGAGTLAHLNLSSTGGELKQTGEPLNIAIEGAGFLEVVRADGTPAYTRAGSLRINAGGQLATADGSPLAVQIEIPSDAKVIQIGTDGRIFASVEGEDQPVEVGQLELVSFANPAGLQSVGGNFFVATAESGEARAGSPNTDGLGSIRQGYVESSNVQLIEEMVSMMVAQRAFELNSRVIQAADQMMAITNGLYRS